MGRLAAGAAAAAAIAALWAVSRRYGWDKDAAMQVFVVMKRRLGPWAIPAYVAAHTVTLALCLPYAVFFEAGAAILFGFSPAVLCVFSAKVLGASLSFNIGRFGVSLSLLWNKFWIFGVRV